MLLYCGVTCVSACLYVDPVVLPLSSSCFLLIHHTKLFSLQKAQHLEELLPSLVSDAMRPPAHTTPATQAEVTAMISTNTATTEGYLAVSCP